MSDKGSLVSPSIEHVPPSVGFPEQWVILDGQGGTLAEFTREYEAQAFAHGYVIGVRHGQWSSR